MGNLVIGYNEADPDDAIRGGSHNMIVGPHHEYKSYGGIVVGENNVVGAPYTRVTGGKDSRAIGGYSSVSGGHLNTASASGGTLNTAYGTQSSISGGWGNSANEYCSTISVGQNLVTNTIYDHVP